MQLGVHGAANVGGDLYLFRQGVYWRAASDSTDAPLPHLGKLSDIPNWPTSSNWQLGLVDAVGSGHGDSSVAFVRGNEVIIVDFGQGEVKLSPIPLSEGYGGELSKLLGSGAINTLLYDGSVSSASVPLAAFQDAAVLPFAGTQAPPPAPAYVAALYGTDQLPWPDAWHPLLAHAPAGRVGDLWAVTRCGAVLHDTGDGWVDASLPDGEAAISVAIGSDGAVYAGSADTFHLYDRGRAGGTFRVERYRMVNVVQLAVGSVW